MGRGLDIQAGCGNFVHGDDSGFRHNEAASKYETIGHSNFVERDDNAWRWPKVLVVEPFEPARDGVSGRIRRSSCGAGIYEDALIAQVRDVVGIVVRARGTA